MELVVIEHANWFVAEQTRIPHKMQTIVTIGLLGNKELGSHEQWRACSVEHWQTPANDTIIMKLGGTGEHTNKCKENTLLFSCLRICKKPCAKTGVYMLQLICEPFDSRATVFVHNTNTYSKNKNPVELQTKPYLLKVTSELS